MLNPPSSGVSNQDTQKINNIKNALKEFVETNGRLPNKNLVLTETEDGYRVEEKSDSAPNQELDSITIEEGSQLYTIGQITQKLLKQIAIKKADIREALKKFVEENDRLPNRDLDLTVTEGIYRVDEITNPPVDGITNPPVVETNDTNAIKILNQIKITEKIDGKSVEHSIDNSTKSILIATSRNSFATENAKNKLNIALKDYVRVNGMDNNKLVARKVYYGSENFVIKFDTVTDTKKSPESDTDTVTKKLPEKENTNGSLTVRTMMRDEIQISSDLLNELKEIDGRKEDFISIPNSNGLIVVDRQLIKKGLEDYVRENGMPSHNLEISGANDGKPIFKKGAEEVEDGKKFVIKLPNTSRSNGEQITNNQITIIDSTNDLLKNIDEDKKEADERTKKEVEEKAKKEADEKAKREAEEKTKKEAEEKAKKEVLARASSFLEESTDSAQNTFKIGETETEMTVEKQARNIIRNALGDQNFDFDDSATKLKKLLTTPSEYKDKYIEHFFSLVSTRIAEGKDVSKIVEFLNGLGKEGDIKIDKLIKELEINSENTVAVNDLQVIPTKRIPSIVPLNLQLNILLTRHPLISPLKSSEKPEALIIHDATKQEELFKNILSILQNALSNNIDEINVFKFLTDVYSNLNAQASKEQFISDSNISSNYNVQNIEFDGRELPLLLYKHKEDGSIFLATANKQFVFDSKDIFSDTKLLEEFKKKDAALSKKKFNASQAPTQLNLTEAYFAYHTKIKSIELELIKQPENEEKLNDKKLYKVSIEDLKKRVMQFLKQEISSGEDPILQNKFKELHKLHPEAPDLLKVLKNEESRSLIDNFFAVRFNDKDQEKLTNKIKKAILEDQDLLDYFDRKLQSQSKNIEDLSASYLKLREGNDNASLLLKIHQLKKINTSATELLSSIEKDKFIYDAIDSIIDSISPLETRAKEASTTPIGSAEEEKNVHAIKVFLSQLKSAIEKKEEEGLNKEQAGENIKKAFSASFPPDSKDFKIKFFNSLVNLLKNPNFTNAYTFLDPNRDEPKNKDLLGLFSETFNEKTMESLKTFKDSVKTIDDIKFARTLFLEKKKESAEKWNDSQKLVYSAIFSSLFSNSNKYIDSKSDRTDSASLAQAPAQPSASALTTTTTRQP